MRSVILDLAGDPAWRAGANSHGMTYVALKADPWTAGEEFDLFVVDARGCFARGLEVVSAAVPRGARAVRVLVTERESPADHQLAYRAGATRVIVMGGAEDAHGSLLRDLLSERRR